jgi:hypothetical protein
MQRRTTMKRITINNIIVWTLGLAVALTACTTPISTLGSADNTFAASDTTTSKTGIQTWAVLLNGKNTSVRGLAGDQHIRQTLELAPGAGKSFRITRKFFDANGTQVGSFEASIDANGKPSAPVGSMSAALSPEVMNNDLDLLISSQGVLGQGLKAQLAATPILPKKSPCQKAQNQAARAAAAYAQAANYFNSVCNFLSYGPGCEPLFQQLQALGDALSLAQQTQEQACTSPSLGG